MASEKLFHLLITIFTLWFGITWSKSTWTNTTVKFIFIVFAIWGIIITLGDHGYLVKF